MPADQLSVTIRPARHADDSAVARLAELDAARVPRGMTLVAEVDGEIVAAYGVETGQRIGDPFRRTAELLDLLALRAQRLAPAPPATSISGRLLRRATYHPRAV